MLKQIVLVAALFTGVVRGADKFVDPFSSQKLATLGAQMQTLQAQAENVQLKQQLLQFQAKEVMAEAFKNAGLNPAEWDLDLSTSKFTKKQPADKKK